MSLWYRPFTVSCRVAKHAKSKLIYKRDDGSHVWPVIADIGISAWFGTIAQFPTLLLAKTFIAAMHKDPNFDYRITQSNKIIEDFLGKDLP